ncbi:LytTr DNA-binding domain-containing protein [Arcicella aurantiaca]|uniref:LytTr DNA-binding domain-containing protein n=1 Tax=Arcicella aurantiaca TaxID=591202 RepID=A0A316DYX0_9BACT|nr:LytTR family DNA-binding domain-containing protein [Arcicella aurantiaca]PWK23314.1 LytTr DNA-binding domain-containing protein [Arcicella aurantiaca]
MNLQPLRPAPFGNFTVKVINLLGKKYLLVPDQAKMRRVLLKDIVRLEGVRNYTLIHLTNGEVMISSRTLKVYDYVLEGADFLRIHKAHLINMKCLHRYEAEGMFAVMQNKDKISISRRKRKDFQDRIAIK